MRQLQILEVYLRGIGLFCGAEGQCDVRRLARRRDEMTQEHDCSGDQKDDHRTGSQRSRKPASFLLVYLARFHRFLVFLNGRTKGAESAVREARPATFAAARPGHHTARARTRLSHSPGPQSRTPRACLRPAAGRSTPGSVGRTYLLRLRSSRIRSGTRAWGTARPRRGLGAPSKPSAACSAPKTYSSSS